MVGRLRAGVSSLQLCAVLAVFAVTFPALAWGAEPDWSPDWKAGLEEAKERNCPIIVVAPFKRGTMAPSIFPDVFKDADIIKLSARFVCFYADAERYAEIDTYYAAKFVNSDTGRYGSHQVIFCKPDGTEMEKLRLWAGVTKGKVTKNMKAALARFTSAISSQQYSSCKTLRDRAELLRGLGAYTEAVKAYEELAQKKSEIRFVKEAKDKPAKLKKEAAGKVEEAAKALKEGDPQQKAQALRNLHIYFYGMKKLDAKAADDPEKTLHQRVRDLLALAKKDKALKTQYRLGQKTAKAFEQFVKAELAFLDGNYKSAMKYYRKITRSYDETEFYDSAKARIQEIVRKFTPEKKSTTP